MGSPHCSHDHGAGRRQVKESRSARQAEFGPVAASYVRYHDLLITGRELNNATTVPWPTPSTSSRNGRAPAAVGGIDRINHIAMVWNGRRVRGEDGRIFSVFSRSGPTGVATEWSLAGQFRQRSHSHQAVPVGPVHRDTERQKQESGRVHRPVSMPLEFSPKVPK